MIYLLLSISSEIQALDSIFFKVGYGGAWFFSKSADVSYSNPILISDTLSVGMDLKITEKHGISTSYTQNGLFIPMHFQVADIAYKFFPFDWYNQIYIGAGITYLNLYFADPNVGKKIGLNLTYGFYFQFPGNIYLTAEFKNIFHDNIEWLYQNLVIQHTFSITGSIAYRLNLQRKSVKP